MGIQDDPVSWQYVGPPGRSDTLEPDLAEQRSLIFRTQTSVEALAVYFFGSVAVSFQTNKTGFANFFDGCFFSLGNFTKSLLDSTGSQ